MNLQYLKYALEIARTGSISKAAENLSVAQPNLSRAVKELETQLGIAIFDRTRTGMSVTPEGERLLSSGEKILRDVAQLETMFESDADLRETVSLAAPAADYLSRAFATFCGELPSTERYDLTYREVGAEDALGSVARGECRLGIIRCASRFEGYYTDLATERGLVLEGLATFLPVVVAGEDSPLAAMSTVTPEQLASLCAIDHPGTLPYLIGGSSTTSTRTRLDVPARACHRDLLMSAPLTYLITAPIPPTPGLITRPIEGADLTYRDLLVYAKTYRLTDTDKHLIRVLREAGEKVTQY